MRAGPVRVCVLLATLLAACAGPQPAPPAAAPPAASGLASATPGVTPAGAEAGIEITAVRVSAAGRLVDLRYRVVDPAKAAAVLARSTEPYALEQATGARLAVPRAGKVGALRQSARQAEAGRVYFILFANSGGVVRPGSRLTLVLGEVRIPDLQVE